MNKSLTRTANLFGVQNSEIEVCDKLYKRISVYRQSYTDPYLAYRCLTYFENRTVRH